MDYPKPIMRMSELKKLGYPETWLMGVYKTTPRKSIAWRMSPAPNSPILFDTEALEEYRKAQCTGE